MMINKKTRVKWIKIKYVDRHMRTPLKLAIRRAGIHMVAPPRDDGRDNEWAILFPENEVKKLLLD